jgi:hypothetical protein
MFSTMEDICWRFCVIREMAWFTSPYGPPAVKVEELVTYL